MKRCGAVGQKHTTRVTRGVCLNGTVPFRSDVSMYRAFRRVIYSARVFKSRVAFFWHHYPACWKQKLLHLRADTDPSHPVSPLHDHVSDLKYDCQCVTGSYVIFGEEPDSIPCCNKRDADFTLFSMFFWLMRHQCLSPPLPIIYLFVHLSFRTLHGEQRGAALFLTCSTSLIGQL